MAASLFAGVIFGGIGFGAFIYGKKQSSFKCMVIGIILMAYPYFIANVFALYLIGVLLTLSLFLFPDW